MIDQMMMLAAFLLIGAVNGGICTVNDHIGGRFKMHSNLNFTELQVAVLGPNDYDVDGIEVQFGAQCDVCSTPSFCG